MEVAIFCQSYIRKLCKSAFLMFLIIICFPSLCRIAYSSIYQQMKTTLEYGICSNAVCTYVKNASGVSYQNKWDKTLTGFIRNARCTSEFSVDRFITLCLSGLSPSVPVPPVRPGVIFRVDWEKFAVLVCQLCSIQRLAWLFFFLFFSWGNLKCVQWSHSNTSKCYFFLTMSQ